MIGTSLAEYVFIRVSIFLLQYSVHLCVAGLGLALSVLILLDPSSSSHYGYAAAATATTAAKAFAALLGLEALFAVAVYLPYRRRFLVGSAARHPPPAPTRAARAALFSKVLANVPEPAAYLRLWFLGADEAEIRRDNVREFFLWAFFDRDAASMKTKAGGGEEEREEGEGGSSKEEDEEIEEELESYIRETEALLGHPLAPGRGSARSLRLTIDAIESRYRSVVWYLIVGLVDVITHALLTRAGFRYCAPPLSETLAVFPPRPQLWLPGAYARSPAPGMGYWYRPHTAKGATPVVFIHGIGIGLWPYTNFLAEINAGRAQDDQIGVIALEILPISMRLQARDPLSRRDFLAQLTAILDHHGWDRVVLAAHSYGSVLTTHAVRSPLLGPRVESVVLVDPVSLLLHLPDVAFNFTRRRPRRANEWQLWYFASMDPGAAHALGRHFFWRENLVWKEELLDWAAGGSGEGEGEGEEGDDTTAAASSSSSSASSEKKGGAGPEPGATSPLPTAARRKRKVAVCISGRDLIVDALTLRRYLTYEGDLKDHNHNTSTIERGESKAKAGTEAGAAAVDVPGESRRQKGEENHYAVPVSDAGQEHTTAAATATETETETETGTAPAEGHLRGPGVELLFSPDLDHAQIFDSPKDRRRVVEILRRYCTGSST